MVGWVGQARLGVPSTVFSRKMFWNPLRPLEMGIQNDSLAISFVFVYVLMSRFCPQRLTGRRRLEGPAPPHCHLLTCDLQPVTWSLTAPCLRLSTVILTHRALLGWALTRVHTHRTGLTRASVLSLSPPGKQLSKMLPRFSSINFLIKRHPLE